MKAAFDANPQFLARISKLEGAHLFITGGTGFFGKWLLQSLAWVHSELNVDFRVTVLTRDPQRFINQTPELTQLSFLTLHPGDIQSFEFPKEKFSHLIHAATDANAQLISEKPLLILDTIIQGTRRALDFAVQAGVKRFLFVSSGAVYGRQLPEVSHITEDTLSGPDVHSPNSVYGESKRVAEYLCHAYFREFGIETVNARCFAFVGPYMQLNGHFAIGNFILDAMSQRPLHISGDGTPFRSYLYGADLAVWLLALLLDGTPSRSYNVGSETAISVAALAQLVQDVIDSPSTLGHPSLLAPDPASRMSERYVPSTQRIQTELGLKESIDLREAIYKTAQWARRVSS